VILLAALLLGLAAGWAWAHWRNQPYRGPELRVLWLVPAALLPQLVLAYLPVGSSILGSGFSMTLPLSLVGFLAFVWINRGLPGMPILLIGLILNLLVISSNGGWMPISPETAGHLPGSGDLVAAGLGSRFGQKDVLLRPEDTRLEILSDRFLIPDWVHFPTAFSLGDVLIAVGTFWLLAHQRAAPNSIVE
jgi:hypothetical protein